MSIKINLPDIGVDEVEVSDILVNVGDVINEEQILITVEGEKALMDVVSPFSGVVKEIKISKGDIIKTGDLIMIFSVKSKSNLQNCNSNKFDRKSSLKSLISNVNNYVHASPLVRRLARKFNINLNNVVGTGPKKRILSEDVHNYIKVAVKTLESDNAYNNYNEGFSSYDYNFSKFGDIEEISLNRIQKISCANLIRNWRTIPHVTIMEEVDITELEIFRKKQNIIIKKFETKITPLVIAIKAVGKALEEMPLFNSSLSIDFQKIVLKKYINIGIAVDTKKALLVPVIKDVNKKGILEIAKELKEISNRARNGKLRVSETQGSGFTISSIGNIGSTNFTPIINAPEVAIMGISRSSIKPKWDGNKFVSRLILPISISFDHRIINGADGVRFIKRISQLISDIRNLIM